MQNIIKASTLLVAALAIVALTIVMVIGSMASASNDGLSYLSQAITSTNASSTSYTLVKRGDAQFGSIVVASSSATAISVYSGVSTTTGQLVATLRKGIAEGTYTFDVDMQKGIVLDVPAAFNGMYVITYR